MFMLFFFFFFFFFFVLFSLLFLGASSAFGLLRCPACMLP
jgi:hypothetical protein